MFYAFVYKSSLINRLGLCSQFCGGDYKVGMFHFSNMHHSFCLMFVYQKQKHETFMHKTYSFAMPWFPCI